MNITVKCKTNQSKQSIENFGNNRYLVKLKSSPENNEANIELINMLAHYFIVPPSHIRIKSGMSNDEKLIEVG